MKILVISLAGIGDTLMATPLIHELRANFPKARLDALVMWPGARDLLEGNPHLDNVIQKNLIKMGRYQSFQFLREFKKNDYDISLNTHPQSRIHYRVVSRVIRARQRISHDYGHTGLLDSWLVNSTIPQDYTIHCVANNLALLPLAHANIKLEDHRYELFLTEAERDWAKTCLASRIPAKKYMGIHVGSGGTKNLALRRWPLKNYLTLINELTAADPDLNIVLFGGPDEENDHARILEQVDHTKVSAPETKNIRQAAALLERCHVFLSVDTALMHLAATVKVSRQLVIETPTFNATVTPYGQNFTLIKNPQVADRHLEFYRYDGAEIRGSKEEIISCMESVTVQQVRLAVIQALGSL